MKRNFCLKVKVILKFLFQIRSFYFQVYLLRAGKPSLTPGSVKRILYISQSSSFIAVFESEDSVFAKQNFPNTSISG